jgi:shikimate 5-dehydrogenase
MHCVRAECRDVSGCVCVIAGAVDLSVMSVSVVMLGLGGRSSAVCDQMIRAASLPRRRVGAVS